MSKKIVAILEPSAMWLRYYGEEEEGYREEAEEAEEEFT